MGKVLSLRWHESERPRVRYRGKPAPLRMSGVLHRDALGQKHLLFLLCARCEALEPERSKADPVPGQAWTGLRET